MIQDKIFFDEKDPTGLSYNTPFTVYGSYEGRLWSKTPSGTIKYYTQNSDLSVYATTGSNSFNGNQTVTGSLIVTEGITGTATTASYVQYSNVANKPTLVSGSAQVSFTGIINKPSGIVSSSVQVRGYNVFATTGSNQFNGSQAVTGSLTVTGQVIAQTLNVQEVTSSIVYSSGSNIFGNSLGNTQQFTGSLQVSGSSHYVLGNVGISTITPQTPLQILRDTTGNGTSIEESNMAFTVLSAAGQSKISIGASNAGNYGYVQVMQDATSWTSRNLVLQPRGGNVGIGTYTPSRTLDVTGTFRVVTPNRSFFVTTNAYSISDGVLSSGMGMDGDGLYLGNVTSSTGWTIGNPQVTIRSSGNVGIGTTSPIGPLDIAVPATGSAIAAANAQQAFDYSRLRIKHYTESNLGLSIGYAGANFTYIQACYNEGSVAPILINPFGGNVGIGATSPATLLNLKSSTTTELRLESVGGTYRSFIGFRTDGQKYDLGVNLNDLQDALSINYAGTERLRITSGGVVEIRNMIAGSGNGGAYTVTNTTGTSNINLQPGTYLLTVQAGTAGGPTIGEAHGLYLIRVPGTGFPYATFSPTAATITADQAYSGPNVISISLGSSAGGNISISASASQGGTVVYTYSFIRLLTGIAY
jgi:hypothetical protein